MGIRLELRPESLPAISSQQRRRDLASPPHRFPVAQHREAGSGSDPVPSLHAPDMGAFLPGSTWTFSHGLRDIEVIEVRNDYLGGPKYAVAFRICCCSGSERSSQYPIRLCADA
jgi:hypothetical protein